MGAGPGGKCYRPLVGVGRLLPSVRAGWVNSRLICQILICLTTREVPSSREIMRPWMPSL